MMMDEDERQAYAQAQRIACRPMECTLDPQCWVEVGGRVALSPRSLSATPRCLACNGKLLLEQWRTPSGMALPPHGRLLTRRAHSQGPAGARS